MDGEDGKIEVFTPEQEARIKEIIENVMLLHKVFGDQDGKEIV